MSRSKVLKAGGATPHEATLNVVNERAEYGRQFLDCVTFLYAEALRLNLETLADNLESTFEDCVVALQKDGALKNKNREDVAEYDFLSSFRKLNKEQQLLLIELLNASEARSSAKRNPGIE